MAFCNYITFLVLLSFQTTTGYFNVSVVVEPLEPFLTENFTLDCRFPLSVDLSKLEINWYNKISPDNCIANTTFRVYRYFPLTSTDQAFKDFANRTTAKLETDAFFHHHYITVSPTECKDETRFRCEVTDHVNTNTGGNCQSITNVKSRPVISEFRQSAVVPNCSTNSETVPQCTVPVVYTKPVYLYVKICSKPVSEIKWYRNEELKTSTGTNTCPGQECNVGCFVNYLKVEDSGNYSYSVVYDGEEEIGSVGPYGCFVKSVTPTPPIALAAIALSCICAVLGIAVIVMLMVTQPTEGLPILFKVILAVSVLFVSVGFAGAVSCGVTYVSNKTTDTTLAIVFVVIPVLMILASVVFILLILKGDSFQGIKICPSGKADHVQNGKSPPSYTSIFTVPSAKYGNRTPSAHGLESRKIPCPKAEETHTIHTPQWVRYPWQGNSTGEKTSSDNQTSLTENKDKDVVDYHYKSPKHIKEAPDPFLHTVTVDSPRRLPALPPLIDRGGVHLEPIDTETKPKKRRRRKKKHEEQNDNERVNDYMESYENKAQDDYC